MRKRAYQEVTPVLYGENMIRVLPVRGQNRGDVCFNGHYHEILHIADSLVRAHTEKETCHRPTMRIFGRVLFFQPI